MNDGFAAIRAHGKLALLVRAHIKNREGEPDVPPAVGKDPSRLHLDPDAEAPPLARHGKIESPPGNGGAGK